MEKHVHPLNLATAVRTLQLGEQHQGSLSRRRTPIGGKEQVEDGLTGKTTPPVQNDPCNWRHKRKRNRTQEHMDPNVVDQTPTIHTPLSPSTPPLSLLF